MLGLGLPMHFANAQALEAPPETPKIPVLNEYHGQKIIDDYEWLENAEEPKVRAWTEAQTKRTRNYLESQPEYNQFLQEFQKDIVGKTVRYANIKFAGGKIFASKFKPPKPQPVIICRTSLSKEGEEQTVFDPAALDEKGLTSYDWFEPSPDGSMIALSVSRGGSESGDLRFIRVADGKLLEETIEHVQFGTAGGSVAWAASRDGWSQISRCVDYRGGERSSSRVVARQEDGCQIAGRYEFRSSNSARRQHDGRPRFRDRIRRATEERGYFIYILLRSARVGFRREAVNRFQPRLSLRGLGRVPSKVTQR